MTMVDEVIFEPEKEEWTDNLRIKSSFQEINHKFHEQKTMFIKFWYEHKKIAELDE